MKRRHYQIIAMVLLFLIGGLFWGATADRLRIDGISGEIWDFIYSTDTKYADGYSDKRFNEIKIGMTEQEVLDVLGEPLTEWNPYQNTRFKDKANFIGFQYSVSPSDTHYRLRQVYFNKGVVAEKIGYFYVD
ncbi:outer membrane protein assembly factor BamE [Cryomorpha ignava]|uniref:Outer membrane protein assembly factor BamE n=1 Tax=Cryomorpha ignava TaxID=101383 RepID=A0A7K3WVJ7_9FLAO|nr:outer membrane protein assembly factor BamE [Cryomorpha ignava]NEN25697.1 outer membrane protein assembly factor BamE [Cryomorpha ignava]